MKGKIFIFLTLIFILIITLSGCGEKTDEEILYEAQKRITNLETYQCTARVTLYGNKDPITYVMKQWFKSPEKYRIEILEPESLNGKTTIYNGKMTFVSHPRIGQGWVMDNYRNSIEEKMFLGYFISNFVNSENAEVERELLDKKEYILLRTEIPGNHPYFYKEKLWFDKENYSPYRLQILDQSEKIRIDVQYYNIQINDKIEDDTFEIKGNI